jgi:hypothetical protein
MGSKALNMLTQPEEGPGFLSYKGTSSDLEGAAKETALKDQETSEEDLRRMLKQHGYRDKAIEAILTWYR